MEKFILIRHGDYIQSAAPLRLSESGKSAIRALATKLKGKCADKRVVMRSSTAPRGVESAEILSEVLGIPFEKERALWSSNDGPGQNDSALYRLIEELAPTCDILILVTHLEYTEWFPEYYAKRAWDRVQPRWGVPKGGALIFDCALKSVTLLSAKA